MKLYACDKCSVVYARADNEPKPVRCTTHTHLTSYTGVLGDYVRYCQGVLNELEAHVARR